MSFSEAVHVYGQPTSSPAAEVSSAVYSILPRVSYVFLDSSCFSPRHATRIYEGAQGFERAAQAANAWALEGAPFAKLAQNGVASSLFIVPSVYDLIDREVHDASSLVKDIQHPSYSEQTTPYASRRFSYAGDRSKHVVNRFVHDVSMALRVWRTARSLAHRRSLANAFSHKERTCLEDVLESIGPHIGTALSERGVSKPPIRARHTLALAGTLALAHAHESERQYAGVALVSFTPFLRNVLDDLYGNPHLTDVLPEQVTFLVPGQSDSVTEYAPVRNLAVGFGELTPITVGR